MAHAVRARPAEVIGDERRVDGVGEIAERVEIRFVERGVPEQIQADPVKHDRKARADTLESLARRQGGSEVFSLMTSK